MFGRSQPVVHHNLQPMQSWNFSDERIPLICNAFRLRSVDNSSRADDGIQTTVNRCAIDSGVIVNRERPT